MNMKFLMGCPIGDICVQNWGDKNTIAVGKTDVSGLETTVFEGASPNVRQKAELDDLDIAMPDREIRSPSSNPIDNRHAEEEIINKFDISVKNSGLENENVAGTCIHTSIKSNRCL